MQSVHADCLEKLESIQLAVSNSRDRTLRPEAGVTSKIGVTDGCEPHVDVGK